MNFFFALVLSLWVSTLGASENEEVVEPTKGINRITAPYAGYGAKIHDAYYRIKEKSDGSLKLSIYGVYKTHVPHCIKNEELFVHVEYPRLKYNQFDLMVSYTLEDWRGCAGPATVDPQFVTVKLFSSEASRRKAFEDIIEPGIVVNGKFAEERTEKTE